LAVALHARRGAGRAAAAGVLGRRAGAEPRGRPHLPAAGRRDGTAGLRGRVGARVARGAARARRVREEVGLVVREGVLDALAARAALVEREAGLGPAELL